MSIETVGFRASDVLPANSLMRITLANHWYNAGGTFPTAARAVYDTLYQRAKVIPTTALTIANGAQVAVIDANLKVAEYGSDLINALDDSSNASDNYAFVSRIELLTGDARDASSSSDGADARAQAEASAAQSTGAANELSKLLASMGEFGSIVKWAGIGIAIIALFYFASPYLARRR